MSVEIQTTVLNVRCDFTNPLQCPVRNWTGRTKKELEVIGWLFVNNTPYIEEAKVYCPRHAKEIKDN